jgi:phenylalanyl-tRNA synthetase alpha chain
MVEYMREMSYQDSRIAEIAKTLKERILDTNNNPDVLRSIELKALFDELKTLPATEKADFGKQLNLLRQDLQSQIRTLKDSEESLPPIDVTAPYDTNAKASDRPSLLPAEQGSRHPINTEFEKVLDIFSRMGFEVMESREIDDDFNMFEALNFPEGHPARDDYDTFVTVQSDKKGVPLIAPAHTSTMQNRALKSRRHMLESGQPIAVVIPGRVFRNEDLDATHEHTFHQLEGIYVAEDASVGNLIATLQTFF